ncbi:MAG: phosphoadenylyl-sulfate reductase [Deltaproteobacteria bacterium]|nr:phosphoadenylyl-sulfate reductase [Deltaproteobacteria bacterium]
MLSPIANEIAHVRRQLQGASPEGVLSWAAQRFAPALGLAASFSVEDSVLIDAASAPGLTVFAIDTGRLPEETYLVAEEWRRRGVTVRWFFPQREAVERLANEKGPFSFRWSLADRHACCAIRKVEPLGRALQGLAAWVTGLRREQSVTRASLDIVEVDEAHGGLVKLNPLAAWSAAQVWARIRERALPYSALHDKGYPSIGCAPCTRAVPSGEHPRAGRWWWESPEHKECGLHVCPVGSSEPQPRS